MSKKFMELCIGVFFLTMSAIIIIVGMEAKGAMDEASKIAVQRLQQQTEIIDSANELKTVVLESTYAILARGMESENLMSPTEANRVVTEALDKVTAYSPKLGLMARSLNDAYLKQSMKRY